MTVRIIREALRLGFVALMVWTVCVWAGAIGGAVHAARLLEG